MADPWFQSAFGRFYPLLYAHRDAAEARRCLDVFDSLIPFRGAGRFLDLGCGGGRHLAHLKRMGCPAVGMDRSPDLLALAADFATELVRGDMRTLPFSSGAFAGVLSLFTAFGYFGVLSANAVQVAEIARTLAPGGHWYLDYFDARKVRSELAGGTPSVRRRDVGPVAVKEQRSLAPAGDQVLKEVRLSPRPGLEGEADKVGIPNAGLTYTEAVALFDLDELDELAGRNGLTRVADAGGYDGTPLGEGERWLLVYQRKDGIPAGTQES